MTNPTNVPQTSARPNRARRFALIGVVAVVVIAIVAIVIGLLSGGTSDAPEAAPSTPSQASTPAATTPPTTDEAEPTASSLARRDPADAAALGSVDAPIVLVEYGDYRCGFCAQAHREVMPLIIEEYVADGIVRIEWRDAPILSQESAWAAVAARAAAEQGAFWEYHDALYAEVPDGDSAWTRERLVALAASLGLDAAAFDAALSDQSVAEVVARDAAEAQAIGLKATPTFFVGDVVIQGARPIEDFREAIASELERLGETPAP